MNAGTTIRKVLFVAFWLTIGGGMLTLLLAAISNRNNGACSAYEINLKGARNNFFIDKHDVETMLLNATGSKIVGEPVSSFRLHDLEELMENNTWIENAELYFDNENVLHVTVHEKEPVARIFTTNGQSFYIDSAGRKMPLSAKLSAELPVFTGFPGRKVWTAADSALMMEVKSAANFILNDKFWMSQVAQVDITPAGQFEMIPLVGNHIVRLGDGSEIDRKFHRLMVFYKRVLSKSGFDKYKIIDVQYRGQVVASRYEGDAKVDSIQLRRNIDKLLNQYLDAENDTVVKVLPPMYQIDIDSAMGVDSSLHDIQTVNPERNRDPNPLKLSVAPAQGNKKPAPERKPSVQPVKPVKPVRTQPVKDTRTPSRTPKAVMPKRTQAAESEYGY